MCLSIMYRLILIIIILPATAIADSFSGVWHQPWCDKEISKECGGFTLYLVQNGKRICGDHNAATPSAGRLNEGFPLSVIGRVVGNTAVIVITSGRDNTSYLAIARRKGYKLNWNVVEQVKDGKGPDSPLVSQKGMLTPFKDEVNYQRVKKECKGYWKNGF